jgi:hypothetical protein
MPYRSSRSVLLLMILAAGVLTCSARRGGRAAMVASDTRKIRSGAGVAAAGFRLGTRCRGEPASDECAVGRRGRAEEDLIRALSARK